MKLTTIKAKELIKTRSKWWLSIQLGITRPTLDRRLKFDNWKKGEISILTTLTD